MGGDGQCPSPSDRMRIQKTLSIWNLEQQTSLSNLSKSSSFDPLLGVFKRNTSHQLSYFAAIFPAPKLWWFTILETSRAKWSETQKLEIVTSNWGQNSVQRVLHGYIYIYIYVHIYIYLWNKYLGKFVCIFWRSLSDIWTFSKICINIYIYIYIYNKNQNFRLIALIFKFYFIFLSFLVKNNYSWIMIGVTEYSPKLNF